MHTHDGLCKDVRVSLQGFGHGLEGERGVVEFWCVRETRGRIAVKGNSQSRIANKGMRCMEDTTAVETIKVDAGKV